MTPLVTPVGTAVGSPVSKTIGPAGGTLVAPDGKMEINIPAGALSTNTDISIQPVTNEVDGGIGLSYDFLPNGTKFSKPATLTFHYTDQDIMGNDPVFLSIAYQDSSGKWITNLKEQFLDSSAKTLKLDISHFTIYSTIDLGFSIIAFCRSLQANKTCGLSAKESVWDEVQHFIFTADLADKYVTNWKVNDVLGGNSTDGTIEGSGSHVIYRAPAHISEERKVWVSAHFKGSITASYRGEEIQFPNGVDIGTQITLEPNEREYNYEIKATVLDSTISGFYDAQGHGLVVYIDYASFNLYIKVADYQVEAKISGDITNNGPQAIPPTKDYHGEEFVWLPDSYGEINIKDVRVAGGTDVSQTDSIVSLDILHSSTYYPGYLLKNSSSGSVDVNNPPILFGGTGGNPPSFEIDLKRKDAYITKTGSFHSYTYVQVTPK